MRKILYVLLFLSCSLSAMNRFSSEDEKKIIKLRSVIMMYDSQRGSFGPFHRKKTVLLQSIMRNRPDFLSLFNRLRFWDSKNFISWFSKLSENDQKKYLAQKDENGQTLLHHAACLGDYDFLDYVMTKKKKNKDNFFDCKTLVAAKDDRGMTPLHCLVAFGPSSVRRMMSLLFDNTVLFSDIDKDGNTILHYACIRDQNSYGISSRVGIVKDIIKRCSALKIKKNNIGQTPYDIVHKAINDVAVRDEKGQVIKDSFGNEKKGPFCCQAWGIASDRDLKSLKELEQLLFVSGGLH